MRRQGAEGVPYDVFKPELIETALVCHELGLGALIFGESKWSAFCQSTEQLQGQGGGAAMQPPNPLSKYFDCDDCEFFLFFLLLVSSLARIPGLFS